MLPSFACATTPILENIPDSLGDIEIVKTQSINETLKLFLLNLNH